MSCMFVAVGDSVMNHRHISLVLEGLDSVADVFLNRVLLVSARNMFQRFVVDISHIIKVHLYIICILLIVENFSLIFL